MVGKITDSPGGEAITKFSMTVVLSPLASETFFSMSKNFSFAASFKATIFEELTHLVVVGFPIASQTTTIVIHQQKTKQMAKIMTTIPAKPFVSTPHRNYVSKKSSQITNLKITMRRKVNHIDKC